MAWSPKARLASAAARRKRKGNLKTYHKYVASGGLATHGIHPPSGMGIKHGTQKFKH